MTTPGHPLGNANIRLPPPPTFDGSGDFDEWKKKFRMYLLSISMRTVDILDDYMIRNVQQSNDDMVALYDREETPVSSQVRYLSSIVYALLSHGLSLSYSEQGCLRRPDERLRGVQAPK